MKQELLVTKNTGELQPFDRLKLINSLKRSGASDEIIDLIVTEIEGMLYDGIPTKKIYRTAFKILRKKSVLVSSHYKLKEALIELGPTGYPFEILIAKLFEKMGYKVSTGKIINGACIQHEVDVVAKMESRTEIVECKFHNRSGLKSDIKVPLYVQSRYLDILSYNNNKEDKSKFNCWLVTNTRFTDDAIKYSKCMGLSLLSWDYPERNSLKERIGASGLYPITVMNKLTKKEKDLLLEKGFVLCEDVLRNKDQVAEILHYKSIKGLCSEAEDLTGKSGGDG